jgi:pimeloyl-ACP methyl ester carboxylesterase
VGTLISSGSPDWMDVVMASEHDVRVESVTLRVRESGDPGGQPVLHFHGTPGSRLEMAWADDILADLAVRWISFDRPGYGGSTPAPFSVRSVANMALHVAEHYDLGRFRVTGWSGGGPFALGTAAVAGERVEAVGVIAGAGPFQLVPGALDALSEGDRAAEQLLPGDPEGACNGFVTGFELTSALESSDALYEAFEPSLSDSDRQLWSIHSEQFLVEMREAMRQGVLGCGWDNVAWIGPWDVDPTTVRCPVLLWYGTEDRMAPPIHGQWFADNLPNARLNLRDGEGHLQAFAHLPQMLHELMTARPTEQTL